MKKNGFPFYKQLDYMDCGPTCLRMIARYYGKTLSLQSLREKCFVSREGVSLLGISDAAEAIGFTTRGAKVSLQDIVDEASFPLIAYWRQEHFVVVYNIDQNVVTVADPAFGLLRYTMQEFLNGWQRNSATANTSESSGIVLFLEPSSEFYTFKDENELDKGQISFLLKYLTPYKRYIFQLFLGIFTVSILQLIFPFLTQSIVDVGIRYNNIGFIYLLLIGQAILMISRAGAEFIRSWILLHLTARVNILLISDFLVKLLKLPMSYFDSKMMGDLLQRIDDHNKIEQFLTSSTLNIIFSLFSVLTFSAVLAIYDINIFFVFLVGSICYSFWIAGFMSKRRKINFKLFEQSSKSQDNLIQLISGIQEIKLQNYENEKRWQWERLQVNLFHMKLKNLQLEQIQDAGSLLINEGKNIIITFLAAKAVLEGELSLGMMLSIQYIIGQLNIPINQLTMFVQHYQDAKISLERLNEIHTQRDEENDKASRVNEFEDDKSLYLQNVGFGYDGKYSEFVLKDITATIPGGKITAIVGASGSGKTTLVKILLKFYEPVQGEVRIGKIDLSTFHNKAWRANCGAVLQDGFIFSDTISNNIAVGGDVDMDRLLNAIKVANIEEFIDSLPLNYHTKIGADGHGLSQGQRQRILIARAVYKNPQFLFFDEATNALDAKNEHIIMENLYSFYKGKTVVIVAHRLSTVKNADKIIVLDKGVLVEQGTHGKLIKNKDVYYELVRNQLELGD